MKIIKIKRNWKKFKRPLAMPQSLFSKTTCRLRLMIWWSWWWLCCINKKWDKIIIYVALYLKLGMRFGKKISSCHIFTQTSVLSLLRHVLTCYQDILPGLKYDYWFMFYSTVLSKKNLTLPRKCYPCTYLVSKYVSWNGLIVNFLLSSLLVFFASFASILPQEMISFDQFLTQHLYDLLIIRQ